MIANVTVDTATIILPITDISYRTFERLNQQLGAYVLLEVDFETENYTKFNVDYSLVEYDNIEEAHLEAQAVYHYMIEYLDITQEADSKTWIREYTEYLRDLPLNEPMPEAEWF